MEIILIGLAIWYYTLRRGRLTVRAYAYLMVLTKEKSPAIANAEALSIGYLAATDYAPMAKGFVRDFYNGKQLPMIKEARKLGFLG